MKSQINVPPLICGRQMDIEPHVGRRLEDVERELIVATLTRCGGNRTWAADILGISVRTLRNRMVQYGEADAVPGRAGRRTRADEDAHLQLLQDFHPGRGLPS